MKTETTLNSKLLDFQSKVGIIKKDAKNPHFKNTYASLAQILSEVKPILTESGVVVIQPIENNTVKTTLIDSQTSEKIETGIDLPVGLTPQQMGSAITYFRRYTLASLLALEIDDDDGNDASHNQRAPKKETRLTIEKEIENAKFEIANAIGEPNLKTVFAKHYRAFHGDEQTQALLKRVYDEKKEAIDAADPALAALKKEFDAKEKEVA